MKKKIDIGNSFFDSIIKENCYFIDKTKFIEEIFNEGLKVTLFTRPRLSGKSFNLSMLESFFNIEKSEENKKLFKNLYIEKSPVFIEQGKYPVIFISLFNVDSEKKFKLKISDIYRKFR